MYLIARREVPRADYYDDGALYENGVGAIRRFVDGFDAGLATVPSFEGRRIRLVTGGSMAPFLRERASRLARAVSGDVDVVEVENRYFGESVTIAGLLGGADILAALGEGQAGDVVVLPAEALNADEVFIDNVSLEELRRRLPGSDVRTGYEITEALGAA
jgi:NifB/MoaA-like Fe-S oxidoreductase